MKNNIINNKTISNNILKYFVNSEKWNIPIEVLRNTFEKIENSIALNFFERSNEHIAESSIAQYSTRT